MNLIVPLHHEPHATSTLLAQPAVLVVKRHHILVRWSHWLNVPLLLGLVLSAISIYWASAATVSTPIHHREPLHRQFDAVGFELLRRSEQPTVVVRETIREQVRW